MRGVCAAVQSKPGVYVLVKWLISFPPWSFKGLVRHGINKWHLPHRLCFQSNYIVFWALDNFSVITLKTNTILKMNANKTCSHKALFYCLYQQFFLPLCFNGLWGFLLKGYFLSNHYKELLLPLQRVYHDQKRYTLEREPRRKKQRKKLFSCRHHLQKQSWRLEESKCLEPNFWDKENT